MEFMDNIKNILFDIPTVLSIVSIIAIVLYIYFSYFCNKETTNFSEKKKRTKKTKKEKKIKIHKIENNNVNNKTDFKDIIYNSDDFTTKDLDVMCDSEIDNILNSINENEHNNAILNDKHVENKIDKFRNNKNLKNQKISTLYNNLTKNKWKSQKNCSI